MMEERESHWTKINEYHFHHLPAGVDNKAEEALKRQAVVRARRNIIIGILLQSCSVYLSM
jgi:hypothetical protein